MLLQYWFNTIECSADNIKLLLSTSQSIAEKWSGSLLSTGVISPVQLCCMMHWLLKSICSRFDTRVLDQIDIQKRVQKALLQSNFNEEAVLRFRWCFFMPKTCQIFFSLNVIHWMKAVLFVSLDEHYNEYTCLICIAIRSAKHYYIWLLSIHCEQNLRHHSSIIFRLWCE